MPLWQENFYSSIQLRVPWLLRNDGLSFAIITCTGLLFTLSQIKQGYYVELSFVYMVHINMNILYKKSHIEIVSHIFQNNDEWIDLL